VVAGTVDADAALESALPRALAAKDDDDEVAAVRTLLEALHDPATFVAQGAPPPPDPAPPRATSTRTVDGVLVATVAGSTWGDIRPAVERLSRELAAARLVVLDVRAPSPDTGWVATLIVNGLAPLLVAHDGVGLDERSVEHRGYRPQSGQTSGQYATLFTTRPPEIYVATKRPHPAHVVFVANEGSGVPEVAWAMQRVGDATILVQAHLPREAFAETRVIPLGGGWAAHLRQTVIGGAEPRPDVTLDEGAPDAKVIDAAVRAARRPPGVARPRTPALALPEPSWRPDAAYADQPYPSRERRLLALFRFWNVIERFYPYLPLMGGAWDRALVDFLPRFESAGDAREYALGVAELAARIPDGHVWASGSFDLDKMVGAAFAPFDTQVLDGQVVVTALHGTPPPAGVAVGDVILAVGGQPIDAAMKTARKYLAGSNESYLADRAAGRVLAGEVAEKLRVTVRDKTGATHDVSLTRVPWSGEGWRTGPVYRLLDPDVGYADLDRLRVGDVDAMFTAFEKTTAIVFDMRGYPHETAWAIAPRLNVRHAKAYAQIFEPFVAPGPDDTPSYRFFEDDLPPTDKPLHRGKTVMLIDERTMSQAEHTGLLFETANGTAFVGSQTAGANGDVTNLVLPGAIHVSFSGHDIRHADGRQLQRIGLVPDIRVRPTIEGLRAGRDEVLDRAVAYLRTGR
jgi:C-terminal processing protease CtpA/Prc